MYGHKKQIEMRLARMSLLHRARKRAASRQPPESAQLHKQGQQPQLRDNPSRPGRQPGGSQIVHAAPSSLIHTSPAGIARPYKSRKKNASNAEARFGPDRTIQSIMGS